MSDTNDKGAKAKQVLKAFQGVQLKRKPRSPAKAEWLRQQGIDPEAPYKSWKPQR